LCGKNEIEMIDGLCGEWEASDNGTETELIVSALIQNFIDNLLR
jgi:hypothetical protein